MAILAGATLIGLVVADPNIIQCEYCRQQWGGAFR